MPGPIVHVIDDLAVGGAQQVLVAFAVEAQRRGLGMLVVVVEDRIDPVVRARLVERGARVELLPQRPGGPLRRARQLAALVKLLRREHPVVAHLHLTYANVLGTFAARAAGVPAVAMLHSAHAGDDGNTGRMLAVETAVLRLCSRRVLAVGPRAARAGVERLHRKVPGVSNAVPSPAPVSERRREQVRAALGYGPDDVVVLAAGRLTEAKAHDVLLAAAGLLDGSPVRIAVAGAGPLEADMKARVRRTPPGRVQLLGQRDDVAELVAACDVFVQPSRFEALPMAVLEAMAAGRPVVATTVGDMPTALRDVGLLIPPEDPAALAEAIRTLAGDRELRERLGAAARERAEQEYGAGPWLDQLLTHYVQAGADGLRRVRVALLIQKYWPWIGGAERQLGDVAPALAASGLDVHVITRQLPGTSRLEHVDGVPVHRIPVPGWRPLASVTYTLRTLLLLRRLRPDVVHAHELLSPATTALGARLLFGVRASATAHRSGPLGDVAVLTGNEMGGQRLRLLARWIDRFIVIASEISDELEAAGVPRSRQMHIANGVDTDRFRPPVPGEAERLRTELGLPSGPMALFTGRLAPEKRVGMLIDLWPRVREAVPDAQLVIAGTGPEEDDLRRRAGDGVLLAGPVEDVAGWHRTADVFVLPSMAEGLSVAMLEAMASGSPPVMSAVGGTGDVLAHGETAWLVNPDVPEELVAGLVRLLSDPAERGRLGAAARERAVSGFSLATTVRRHAELYRELAGVTRSRRPRWWGSR